MHSCVYFETTKQSVTTKKHFLFIYLVFDKSGNLKHKSRNEKNDGQRKTSADRKADRRLSC